MYKTPQMTNNQITQAYTDGVVTIFTVTDTAVAGYQPQRTTTFKATLRYAEQRVGIQRYYEAKQNNVEVTRVIRTPRIKGISSQDIAVTEDGNEYRIDLVQLADSDSMDLTLERIVENYEQI